ncbi:unnamed protein product [Hydatigera taeniaeformis]|uniref:VOC domain-containing protein n=1 Tax=Hydatigena taeniaeformis TaxID=6205 RepID=A0A0R3X0K9_HYDTA|nr:unnamed protein product [Hydatigera taeniaeformis]
MDLKVVFLRLLHSLALIFYACVTWLFAGFFDIKHTFNRHWNGGLNFTSSPFLHVDKPVQDLDHIAFVIYEDDLSIPTLCQLILICVNLQIGDVSITAKARKSLVQWPSHKCMNPSHLFNVLHTYSRITKRCGR